MGNKDGLQTQLRQPGADPATGGGWRRRWRCTRSKKRSAWSWATRTVCRRSYGNQALILKAWGRLEEALALLKKQEAICLELGNKSGLGYCYWHWGLLARAQGDRKTEKEKLEQALAIFTELKMPRERDAVQAELEKVASG